MALSRIRLLTPLVEKFSKSKVDPKKICGGLHRVIVYRLSYAPNAPINTKGGDLTCGVGNANPHLRGED